MDRERSSTLRGPRAPGGRRRDVLHRRPTPDEQDARRRWLEPLDYDASDKYMSLPKERRIVFVCANGDRSLDVASYFLGHGFTNVYAVRGGLAAWNA